MLRGLLGNMLPFEMYNLGLTNKSYKTIIDLKEKINWYCNECQIEILMVIKSKAVGRVTKQETDEGVSDFKQNFSLIFKEIKKLSLNYFLS